MACVLVGACVSMAATGGHVRRTLPGCVSGPCHTILITVYLLHQASIGGIHSCMRVQCVCGVCPKYFTSLHFTSLMPSAAVGWSAECGVRKGIGRRPVRWTRAVLEDGGLGWRGRSEGEGEWRPGLRPSSTLAGPLLVGDVGEGGAFRWRGAPTHRRRPAAEASGRIGVARDRRVVSAQTHDSPR